MAKNRRISHNPNYRGKKYAVELHERHRVNLRTGEIGEKLTDTQLAYRGGYEEARNDAAAKFRKDHPDYVRKTAGKNLVLKG